MEESGVQKVAMLDLRPCLIPSSLLCEPFANCMRRQVNDAANVRPE